MAIKLSKGQFPVGTKAEDFKCYGPPAVKDTEFETARIADMGCFSQEKVDSNKFYHVCMCTHKTTGKWYVYVEYGREGVGKPQFQWFECVNEADARKQFEQKCHEKNTKRGKWSSINNITIFVPKPGKDLYCIRKLAKRSYGLPDSKNMIYQESENIKPVTFKTSKKSVDNKSFQLMKDLLGGTLSYAKSSLKGGILPLQSAIDEARELLDYAKIRISSLGNDIRDQVQDSELKKTTYALYSRIPKYKPLNVAESDWILSQDNILAWEQDLSAFETAIQSTDIEYDDPFEGYPLDMEWIDPVSELGIWLNKWWSEATRNKHTYLGKMKIFNMWKIERHGDKEKFLNEVKKLNVSNVEHRPLHQDKKRFDLDTETRKVYWNKNVSMLFHGSRTVNIANILKTNLKLPKELVGVKITGAIFGQGLYWADDWKKSAGYTSLKNSYWAQGGGSIAGRHAFMFAADVLLGNPYLTPAPYPYTSPKSGYDCVFAKGGYSNVANNEWIVYTTGRNLMNYLIEFEC